MKIVTPQKKKESKTEEPDVAKITEIKDSFVEVDSFLHEPIRLQIMTYLNAVEKADMIFLKNMLNITWGNLSFHTTKLEEKEYLQIKKTFIAKKPHTIIQITEKGKNKFEDYRKAMKNFLQK